MGEDADGLKCYMYSNFLPTLGALRRATSCEKHQLLSSPSQFTLRSQGGLSLARGYVGLGGNEGVNAAALLASKGCASIFHIIHSASSLKTAVHRATLILTYATFVSRPEEGSSSLYSTARRRESLHLATSLEPKTPRATTRLRLGFLCYGQLSRGDLKPYLSCL